MKRLKNFALDNTQWKKSIPVPVYDEKPEYIAFYERAWELAHDHIKDIQGLPQTPYMDEAFCNTDIWIWDTCFMMFFCKYAPDVFPGIETLVNFYKIIHDAWPLPIVRIKDGKPPRKADGPDDVKQLCLHIPDNPPLFAWAELNYAMMTGDREHLRKLLLEERYLQKHFSFLENLTEKGWKTKFTRAPTCLVKRPDGYYWEGGRSGMDNTPRGREGNHASAERPNNPKMLWIDAISQQALSCLCISRIAALLDEEELRAEWEKRYSIFKEKINRLYWDDADGMYYDLLETTMEKIPILTPASFWPLLAEIPGKEQANRMCHALEDTEKLGGAVPWVSLSRDDSDFSELGDYWRGSVWLPTAYMGTKGLEKYGHFKLAHACARKILDHMYRTWREYEPHTIWECYDPVRCSPARTCRNEQLVRPDFCGWSALGPISLFIENVIGITGASAFTNTVEWHLPENSKDAIGIRNYTFGSVTADMIYHDGLLETVSDAPFTLLLDRHVCAVPAGKSSQQIQ